MQAVPEPHGELAPTPGGDVPGAEPERGGTRTISRGELLRVLAAGAARVVETLGPMYYADAHLPGAVDIPPDLVAELAPVLLPDRDEPVVTYGSDATCRNAEVVARRLAASGYTDVSRYAGGKQDWVAAGLPVERGGPHPDEPDRCDTSATGP